MNLNENQQPVKVMIGIPGYEGIIAECQEGICGAAFRLGRETNFDVAIKVIVKKEQFRARNSLVHLALAGGFDYLCMLDDDMVIPHNLISKLIAHNKDVVGALYYQRGGLYRPVVMQASPPNKYGEVQHTFWNHSDPRIIDFPGLHEADIIGGGCMLFKTEVFNKLVPPYFHWERELGTDIAICTRLREMGYQPYIDTSIELGHYGEKRIVTSRTIPMQQRLVNEIIERIGEDLEAYFHEPVDWIRQQMEVAIDKDQRKTRWGHTDPTDWDSLKLYYQDHAHWHIFNLAAWNCWTVDEIRNWAVTEATRFLAPGDAVLDYGPGIGFVSVPLAENHDVYAVEVANAGTLDFLAFRARRTLADAERLHIVEIDQPYPVEPLPQKVKMACIISVLNHLSEPLQTMKWIRDQMEPGGLLICDWRLESNHDEGAEPQHLDAYDIATFRPYLFQLGFFQRPEYPWLFQLD